MRIPISSYRIYATREYLKPINTLIKKSFKDDTSLPHRAFSRLGYTAFNFENDLSLREGLSERYNLDKLD